MSIVKQVSVYDGTQEKWDGPHDIGANASNVSLSSTMSGGTNVEDTLKKLVGANSRQLTGNKIVTTTQGGTLTTSTVSSASLEGLSDMVVTDDAGAPTEDVEFVSGDTTLTPASTSEVSLLTSSDSWSSRLNKISLMFRNIRYLINKLGNTDLTGIGDGTVTGAINALKPVILYKADSFIDQGDIVLSQSAFDFDKIVIYYCTNDMMLLSTTLYIKSKYHYLKSSEQYNIILSATHFNSTNTTAFIKSKIYSLKPNQGTLLVRGTNSSGVYGFNGQAAVNQSGNSIQSGGNFISVISVMGYYI